MRWKVQPPLLAAIIVALAGALHRYGPAIPVSGFTIIGWVLLLLGACLGGWARTAFTRRNTTLYVGGKSTHLVAHGPFKYSRNPMYVSITICFCALGLITESAYYLAGAAVFFTVIAVAYVPFEEQALLGAFGQEYEDYRRRVRRWV